MLHRLQASIAVRSTALPNEEVLNLRLPCREEYYRLGVVGDSETLQSNECNGSIGAQFVGFTVIWYVAHEKRQFHSIT